MFVHFVFLFWTLQVHVRAFCEYMFVHFVFVPTVEQTGTAAASKAYTSVQDLGVFTMINMNNVMKKSECE
eukprot:g74688.t1